MSCASAHGSQEVEEREWLRDGEQGYGTFENWEASEQKDAANTLWVQKGARQSNERAEAGLTGD